MIFIASFGDGSPLFAARLRRLNDTECPFILAKQWVNVSQEESACAKSLVFQESQNGDIPV